MSGTTCIIGKLSPPIKILFPCADCRLPSKSTRFARPRIQSSAVPTICLRKWRSLQGKNEEMKWATAKAKLQIIREINIKVPKLGLPKSSLLQFAPLCWSNKDIFLVFRFANVTTTIDRLLGREICGGNYWRISDIALRRPQEATIGSVRTDIIYPLITIGELFNQVVG